jgi:hypothetical protein
VRLWGIRPPVRPLAAVAAVLAGAGTVAVLVLRSDGDEAPPERAPQAPTGPERADRPERRERGAGRKRPEPRGSPRPQPMEVALQDDAVFLQRSYYNRELALRQARRLQVSRLRVNVIWARVLGRQAERRTEPPQLRYDWRPYDQLVAAAARHGIRLQLALTGPAPAWASGDGRVGPERPSANGFGAFAAAAAGHFRGRVDRYSIWNEPNYVGWLSPLSGAPESYRALYEAARAAIERADPRASVLIGETAPYAQPGRATAPLAFLRSVTCRTPAYRPAGRCPRLRADGYAHHPYDFERPPERGRPGKDDVTLGSLDRLTRALDRLARSGALRGPGGRPLDLYLTEFGYFAKGERRLPDPTRAAYLTRGFELARRNRRVRQLLQYLLVAPPRGFPSGYFDTSIVRIDGRLRPPYRALVRWATDARQRGRIAGP